MAVARVAQHVTRKALDLQVAEDTAERHAAILAVAQHETTQAIVAAAPLLTPDQVAKIRRAFAAAAIDSAADTETAA